MTSHLPVQLRDGTAAFVSRLYTIAGHDFAAFEQPDIFVEEMRSAFRKLREQ
jgi:hypothetical protein